MIGTAVAGGGNRFTGRGAEAPTLPGMPAPALVVAPAVVPAGIGREARIPIGDEWNTQRRDLFGGKAITRVQVQDGYWAKFSDPSAPPFRYSFATDGSPVMPGAAQQVLVGVFEVPSAMTACLRYARFGAQKSVGGVEQPLLDGDLSRVLFFALLDDGAQTGAVTSFVATPPAGGFTFGTGTNLQRPVQTPGTVLSAGPGPARGRRHVVPARRPPVRRRRERAVGTTVRAYELQCDTVWSPHR